MTLINEKLIEINVALKHKEEVISLIADLLSKDDRLLDKEAYINDVYQREAQAPTALGFSFAIPHAKSEGVKTASLVFIELEEEINWTESEKVKYVFGIAVPLEQAEDDHLKILSMLARRMMNDEFRNGLRNARTKNEYLALIYSEQILN